MISQIFSVSLTFETNNYIILGGLFMANKRTLKRTINLLCEELFAECLANTLYGTGNDNDNCEALAYSIIKLQSDFICRISHPEPGMLPKAYYKKLKEDFIAQASDIIDQINNHH